MRRFQGTMTMEEPKLLQGGETKKSAGVWLPEGRAHLTELLRHSSAHDALASHHSSFLAFQPNPLRSTHLGSNPAPLNG